MKIKCRCTRCNTTWDATVRGNAFVARQADKIPLEEQKDEDETGENVTCPRCGRGYYRRRDGKWYSDRFLEIIS